MSFVWICKKKKKLQLLATEQVFTLTYTTQDVVCFPSCSFPCDKKIGKSACPSDFDDVHMFFLLSKHMAIFVLYSILYIHQLGKTHGHHKASQ